jgi:hypothetical protein
MSLLRMWRLFCGFNFIWLDIIIWNISPLEGFNRSRKVFTKCEKLHELRDRDDIPLLVECKKEF